MTTGKLFDFTEEHETTTLTPVIISGTSRSLEPIP